MKTKSSIEFMTYSEFMKGYRSSFSKGIIEDNSGVIWNIEYNSFPEANVFRVWRETKYGNIYEYQFLSDGTVWYSVSYCLKLPSKFSF